MASKKISYNDLKKQNDSNQLAQAFSAGKTVVSQNTGFEKVKVEDIAEDPKGDFTEIFPFYEEMAKSIAASIIARGYDKTQVIHLFKIREEPETMDKPIRGDGAHRVAAAKIAGIEEVPAYIHTFDTRTEALIYAYELQILRRNLEPYQKLDAMAKLDKLKNPGKKTDGENTGKSSEEIADVLGVSPRTAERMRNIINNADDETLEAVKSGEMSISKADKVTNEKKKSKKSKPDKDDDISESLSTNEGTPAGLNFNHSDGIERPSYRLSPEEDSERTKERKAAYEAGLKKGSDLAYEIYDFILSEIESGKSAEKIRNDSHFADFSVSRIYRAFNLSDEQKQEKEHSDSENDESDISDFDDVFGEENK